MKAAIIDVNFQENEISPLYVNSDERPDFGLYYKEVKHNDSCECFQAIYKQYYNQLLFLAKKYVKETEDAEEVLSEVFLKLWNKRKEISINTSFHNYLYTSVRNKALDFLRKNKNRTFESDDYASQIPCGAVGPDELIDSEDLFNRIENAIEELPEKRRQIFKMSRTEGLKYCEIAEKLGVSIKTVETQMGRSLKYLREKFEVEIENHLSF
jgi:RNA polymerase sigma-70 factor (ECF subfamily)